MLKKFLKPLAKYLLGGILPVVLLQFLKGKLESSSSDENEHLDEVLINAALTAIVMVSAVSVTLLFVRWLVVAQGVESGPLVFLTAWLAGIAVLLLFVLPAFWTWKRYGFFNGIVMLTATSVAVVVLVSILIALLIFFGFGLKLLRN